jgi:hypothetical protein
MKEIQSLFHSLPHLSLLKHTYELFGILALMRTNKAMLHKMQDFKTYVTASCSTPIFQSLSQYIGKVCHSIVVARIKAMLAGFPSFDYKWSSLCKCAYPKQRFKLKIVKIKKEKLISFSFVVSIS